MSLMFEPLRKYATFSGRARRKEYWLFWLFTVALSLALSAWLLSAIGPDAMSGSQPLAMEEVMAMPAARTPLIVIGIVSLLLLLPQLAVSVRRLHDSDKSGWWLLLNLIPFGALVLLIFFLLDGTPRPNRHGPDPKGRSLDG